MKGCILPDALRLAAAGCDDPKWIGAILLALCGRSEKGLDNGQRVVLAMCRAEIGERKAAQERTRQLARERKARYDARHGKAGAR